MEKHTTKRIILLLCLLASALFAAAQHELESVCMNTVKLDLGGYPLSFLYSRDHHDFMRYSIEYERKLKPESQLSGILDIERAIWDEEFQAVRDGQNLKFGNLQKDLSLFAGLRFYLFYGRLKKFERLVFLEPRLGIVRSYAFAPVYDFGPDWYSFEVRKWYVAPRLRGGLSIPVSRNIGFEVSDDLGLRSVLGSGKKHLSQVFELNLSISF